MKILHTADWHLGAKLEGRDRTEEQAEIINEIAKIADSYQVNIVVIAGDVFHNSVPTAAAEDLFFDAITKLSDGGDRLVFVLPGNHDDSLRLGASRPLALKQNIVIASQSVDISKVRQDKKTRIIDAGEGFLRVKCGNEECVIAYLPFISSAKCKELAGGDFNYEQSVKVLGDKCAEHFSTEAFNIFVSHLFVAGGKFGEGDQILVGEALAVSPECLPKRAHYIALGHLHRTQKIGDNIYYSGSATSLRFKDGRPKVLIVEGDKSGVRDVSEVEIKSACSLVKVKVSSIAFAYKELSNLYPNELVELTIEQNSPLKANEVSDLKKQFPNLVSVRLNLMPSEGEQKSVTNRRSLSDKDLFIEFYKHTTGAEPDSRLVEMFLEIRGNVDVTN